MLYVFVSQTYLANQTVNHSLVTCLCCCFLEAAKGNVQAVQLLAQSQDLSRLGNPFKGGGISKGILSPGSPKTIQVKGCLKNCPAYMQGQFLGAST